jgi:AraC-like DNA-binding protein
VAEYAERNIQFFRELVDCAHGIYSWVYNSRREMVYSNCPYHEALSNVFLSDSEDEAMRAGDCANPRPAVVTNRLGLMWITDFERAGSELFIHVVGPVFYGDVSMKTIDQTLDEIGFSANVKREFMEILGKLPVVASRRMMEYGLMLHYTLTGEKISIGDFQYMKKPSSALREKPDDIDMHGTWAAEQAMLKLVEDGNLSYRKEHARLSAMGNVGKLAKGDPIRQVKNQVIIFTALCTRAAIKGGLSPETAYALSDKYIINTEECKTLGELMEVSGNMQDDFVLRVHNARLQEGMSRQIMACLDYIQVHITEKISIAALAAQVGYSENHLSRKFRQETGQSVTDYINAEKVECAKRLLIMSCELNVQDVAERLGFGTQSYFGEQFKKYTGITAGEYRKSMGYTRERLEIPTAICGRTEETSITDSR